MRKAVFPGTFDPPTYGHFNIIERCAVFFDSLDVVVAVNNSKTPYLPAKLRQSLLIEHIRSMGIKQVNVALWDGLIVEYCRSVDARILIRGVRTAADFDYELELSLVNKQLNHSIETIMLPTESQYAVLRSRRIREIAKLNGDISSMVPPVVANALISM